MGKQSSQSLADQLKPFIAPFRFDGANHFHLKSYKTDEKGGLDKQKGEKIIEANRRRLADFQEKLYAQDRWSLLLIFQAMDAAGKDSAIKHVMSGVNPQGCQVASFKEPSPEELDHDYLWRAHTRHTRARYTQRARRSPHSTQIVNKCCIDAIFRIDEMRHAQTHCSTR